MAIYGQQLSKYGNGINQTELPIFGLSRLGVFKRADNSCNYQITDHLGNVRAVIKKKPGDPVIAIASFADYYPFGEQLPARNSMNNYRYAFQGQELDKETGMEAFQLRLWDGRIGRWLSPDPYGQYASPYLGMGNNPVNGIDPDGGQFLKEYPNAAAYYKENPNGKLDGSDGHWLATDRLSNNSIFATANMYNLQHNLFDEYKTIEQRTAFYGWMQKTLESKGFDTKWAGAAYVIANQMAIVETGGPLGSLFVSDEVAKFAQDGNKAIFNDVFPKLRALLNGSVLTGAKALQWDKRTLYAEQFKTVEPIYRMQSKETLTTLQKMATQTGQYSIMNPDELKFTGDVTNPNHRYNHGMNVAVPFWIKNSPNW
jgi:RHS repeat-associated protein